MTESGIAADVYPGVFEGVLWLSSLEKNNGRNTFPF